MQFTANCFSSAGVHCGGFMAEIDYSDVEKTFEINTHGTFRVIQVPPVHPPLIHILA